MAGNNIDNNIIDIKNISKFSLNSKLIDINEIIKFNSNFYSLVVYLSVFTKYISKNMKKEIMQSIIINLENIGITKDNIGLIVKYILFYIEKEISVYDLNGNFNNNINNQRIELFFYNINEYAVKRKIEIDQKLLENLLNVINNMLDINIKEVSDSVYEVMKNTENNCKMFGNDILYRAVGSRKHPNREIEWSDSSYAKAFNEELKNAVKYINNVLIKWNSNEKDLKIEDVDNIGKIVKKNLIDLNNKLAESVFTISKYNGTGAAGSAIISLNINKGSVLSKISKIKKENKARFVNEPNRDIRKYQDLISQIENTESLDQSLHKLSSLETPLMNLLKNIFDSNLSEYDQQLALEKCLIEYELDFINKNIDNPESRNRLLHKTYPKLKSGYDKLIHEYSINKFLKLRQSIDKLNKCNWDINSKDYYNTIVILIIIYLGVDKCISYSFSQIVSLLNNDNDDKKRTNIVINLANKFIRLINYIKLEDDHILNKIVTLDQLKKRLKNITTVGLFELGDTLLHLITDNCDIIKQDVITDNNKSTHIVLRINDKFTSDLALAGINLVQLPMLTEPRKIDVKGLYYPYINPDTTNLHLFEGDLIKGKYNQKMNTVGSDNLYESINHLNSIKFKINRIMLNFVLQEWYNSESKLFKGHNIFQPILDTDSKDIKAKKLSSNSKYNLYSNIITIASLYRDKEFYLPVFVDFRGRVYPLSNYISYQAGDLGRSLLLFADCYAEKLNKTGIECLNIYLANLAGYDKLPWNDRLFKVDEIINEYVESSKISKNNIKYVEDNLDKISEPFQFISIMVAKLSTLNIPEQAISNPILFDASCSGIQHIASLTLEKELAKNVNVYSNSSDLLSDYPQDFYNYALDKIREKISDSGIAALSDVKLTRKMIKRSVMTIPYNI